MKRIKEVIITAAVITMAIVLSIVMISCGTDDVKSADFLKGSTILETDENGETVVVATGNDGETIVFQTDKSGNIKESRKSETKAKSQTQKSTAAAESATQAQQTTAQATQAQKVCYITIEGYCSSKAVTLQGGDTVYSVLTRSGAAVSAENSQYGIYVNGINGRFASGSSGWMYSVNGYTPNVGCGSYSVSSGDNIRWYWGSAY